MRIRFLLVALALISSSLVPAVVSASPIRLEFAGRWAFYDSQLDSPDFWNALNASGVFQDSPLTLSMFVSDMDTNPDPTLGWYAVSSGFVRVGNVELMLQPTVLRIGPWGMGIPGSTLVGPPAGGFEPFFLQFGNNSGPLSDDLMSAVPYLASGQSELFVGYRGGPINCGICLGYQNVTLTKVEVVPESSTLLLILSGIFVFVVYHRRAVTERLGKQPSSLENLRSGVDDGARLAGSRRVLS